MIFLRNIALEDSIFRAKFACDLSLCKGACCTFPGESGAPVANDEVQLMTDNFEAAAKYLSERNLNYIKKYKFIEGLPDNYTTVCINKRDCVFVYYDGDVAKCAYEKAWLLGESSFRKPISCHLFPIRVHGNNPETMYYVQIPECRDGRRSGEKNQVPLVECLKDAISRANGEEWYDELIQYFRKM